MSEDTFGCHHSEKLLAFSIRGHGSFQISHSAQDSPQIKELAAALAVVGKEAGARDSLRA